MNEYAILITFITFCAAAIACGKVGLHGLYILSVFITLVINVTVGIEAQFLGYAISLGVVAHGTLYFVTDIASEFFPKGTSYRITLFNLAAQLAFTAYIALSLLVEPVGENAAYTAMTTLFAGTTRVTIAGFLATLGSFADIAVYERLLKRAQRQRPDGPAPQLWLRNVVSTFVGQTLSTSIFFGILFYDMPAAQFIPILTSALFVKWIVAVLDTPFMYVARLFLSPAEAEPETTRPGAAYTLPSPTSSSQVCSPS